MNFKQFNIMIRELFKQLINEGYDKSIVCSCTLGVFAKILFDRIVNEEKDITNIPMERLLDRFGYDLLIIPVKSTDDKTKEYVENECITFIKEAKAQLSKHIQTRDVKRGVKKNIELEKSRSNYLEETINNLNLN